MRYELGFIAQKTAFFKVIVQKTSNLYLASTTAKGEI
jgi:hypothetical protein